MSTEETPAAAAPPAEDKPAPAETPATEKPPEKAKKPGRLSMEGMIANANKVLDTCLNPNAKGVPRSLLDGCCGVAMMSVIEAGFLFSGNGGTGVFMGRDKVSGMWSPPSAMTIGGVGFGFVFGADVKDVLILLIDESAVKAFTSMQLKLGAELGIAVGPVGRELESNFTGGKEGGAVALTYTFSKGLFVGAGLNGCVIKNRNEENARFYNKPGVTPAQIILEPGAVTVPEGAGVEELQRKLEMMRNGETAPLPEGQSPKKEVNASVKASSPKADSPKAEEPKADAPKAEDAK